MDNYYIHLLPCMDCHRHNITFHNCLEDFAPSFPPSPSLPLSLSLSPSLSLSLSFPPPYLGRSASSLTMLFFNSTLNPVGSRIWRGVDILERAICQSVPERKEEKRKGQRETKNVNKKEKICTHTHTHMYMYIYIPTKKWHILYMKIMIYAEIHEFYTS